MPTKTCKLLVCFCTIDHIRVHKLRRAAYSPNGFYKLSWPGLEPVTPRWESLHSDHAANPTCWALSEYNDIEAGSIVFRLLLHFTGYAGLFAVDLVSLIIGEGDISIRSGGLLLLPVSLSLPACAYKNLVLLYSSQIIMLQLLLHKWLCLVHRLIVNMYGKCNIWRDKERERKRRKTP